MGSVKGQKVSIISAKQSERSLNTLNDKQKKFESSYV